MSPSKPLNILWKSTMGVQSPGTLSALSKCKSISTSTQIGFFRFG
jgi:hypothetical protein